MITRWILKLIGRYSFVVTLLVLCFLCFALAEAKADTLGLPYNSRFENASYPYARVLSGCTEWRKPAQYGDTWGPVSFAGACQSHDQCFHDPKNLGWGECNRQYLNDLKIACDRDLKRARLEKGELGEPDPSALQLCYQIANLYMERAQQPNSVKRYEIAQKMEAAYLAHVTDVLKQVIKEIKGPAASAADVKTALTALNDGQDMDSIRIMMGGKADGRVVADVKPMPSLESAETSLAAFNE